MEPDTFQGNPPVQSQNKNYLARVCFVVHKSLLNVLSYYNNIVSACASAALLVNSSAF